MATHAARYGAKAHHHAATRAIPALMYGVIMCGIWVGILLMVSPLLSR